MAQCEFAGGIKNVRGTLTKNVHYFKGEKMITRVVASVRGGKQRLYLRKYTERQAPLSQKEMAARNRFREMALRLNALTDEQKQQYQNEWKRDRYKFNAKTYKTLRGYIMARMYAEK